MTELIKYIKGKRNLILAACLFMMCVLSGCSRENQKPEPIPAYIYVPKQLTAVSTEGNGLPDGFGKPAVESGQIYYMRQKNDSQTVEKAVLPEDGSTVDFNGAEILFSLSTSAFEQEEDGSESEILTVLARATEAKSMSGSQGGDKSANADPKKTYFRFSLRHYAVDQEQNVYFIVDCSMGNYYTAESVGSALCKRTAEGEWAYRRFFPGLEPMNDSLAVDGNGGVYILTADGILAVNSDGDEAGMTGTEEYKGASYSSERLVGDSRGNVYYIVFEAFDSC